MHGWNCPYAFGSSIIYYEELLGGTNKRNNKIEEGPKRIRSQYPWDMPLLNTATWLRYWPQPGLNQLTCFSYLPKLTLKLVSLACYSLGWMNPYSLPRCHILRLSRILYPASDIAFGSLFNIPSLEPRILILQFNTHLGKSLSWIRLLPKRWNFQLIQLEFRSQRIRLVQIKRQSQWSRLKSKWCHTNWLPIRWICP